MLERIENINPKLFDPDVELKATRTGFGEGLVLAGQENKNVVALCADLAESTQMSFFRDKFPERFVEMGVAEQNLVTVASGMAAAGKIPFAASYATFNPGRNWEQIRTTICYNDRPVVIVGSHAGLSVGADGGSHQALEDIAMMRALPNMIVLSPCDAMEARKATLAAARAGKPVYLRLAREKTPVITREDTPFEIGKAQVVLESQSGEKAQVGIFATGPLLYNALVAAKELSEEGIAVKVVNVSTIKPLDTKVVGEVARETGAIVTIEEHQKAGGLGGAICEFLAQNAPTPVEFIGVDDKFGQSGKPLELYEAYELTSRHIKEAAKKVISRL
ncbi:MAG: transketolase [Candidatus Taylorbacteria bacterium RIFCSPLOWO2_12_FULL_47_20]|uniref:Transketolase n=2 Tax=Candidatus Tayloriibacteriota TaxID=1817919 RepID=A0A1G2P9U7_9BACT|nr:MAG: transketolase [Candidatus Taylorbacteria bacterium RIFCSPLOWO2_02_FULL_46_40]OHA45043.1 MAG: transketolase [Candidatus Taylorbacteria bacterium RIFCSPLOWO2_12_FULL_47_20]